MKIVHVISSCSPGGAEIFVKNLLIEMKLKGVDVELWVMTRRSDTSLNDQSYISFENKFVHELSSYKIPVQFVDKRPNKDWIKTRKTLIKLFNEKKPGVVHAHLEAVTFHVSMALFLQRAKLIQTIHSIKIKHPRIMHFLSFFAINRFVAISEKVKNISVDVGIKPDKINVILNGINISLFENENRTISSIVRSIVSVGSLTPAKNYKNLITALSILKAKFSDSIQDFPITKIVGDGPLKEELQNFAKEKGVEPWIIFAGVKDNIPEILRESDMYVMSSDWEGLSISLIEALASGIPIVATDAGSNSEIVENEVSGLIVPVNDPNALAEAIWRLINDKALRVKFSKITFQKAKIFSIQECAKKHLALYNEIHEVSN